MTPASDPGADLTVLHHVADLVAERLATVTDWGLSGQRDTQYVLDVETDAVALEALLGAGYGVLSEESGLTSGERDRIVIIDPIDGSTNCSRRIPWYATAMCVVDEHGPVAALVVNQATGTRMEATRGGGAWSNGERLRPSQQRELPGSMIGVSGRAIGHWPWAQYRSLGASALDIGLVAAGSLDGFLDTWFDAHGVWDFAASSLIVTEAGGVIVDALGRDLVVLDHDVRRTPIAAATPELLDELLAARERNPLAGPE